MAGLLWCRSYMDSLANTSGYYPDIHAGHADRVTELTLDAPYLVRETPAGYNQLKLMELVGGTVAWNQLCPGLNQMNASRCTVSATAQKATLTVNAQGITDGRMTLSISSGVADPLINHLYFLTYKVKSSVALTGSRFNYGNSVAMNNGALSANTQTTYTKLLNRGSITPGTYIQIDVFGAFVTGSTVEIEDVMIIDFTLAIGSSIADYVWSIETAVVESGLHWLEDYDIIDGEYHAYSQGSLESVNVSAHVMRDADNNIIETYPTDSSVTLRGMLKKDASNNLYYDGDEYLPDGTVKRYWGERAYQSGDASDGSTMITDGTKTVYKLGAPTTESADPYTAMQDVEEGGTEEFVTGNNVPVGNVSVYRRA